MRDISFGSEHSLAAIQHLYNASTPLAFESGSDCGGGTKQNAVGGTEYNYLEGSDGCVKATEQVIVHYIMTTIDRGCSTLEQGC